AARRLGGRVEVTEDARKAAAGADVIYTDVWTSMGQEAERARRQEAFSRYQVNETIVGFAKPSVLVMHCLPAHRGEEITDAVLDGPHSIALDQAENRLHAQKAVILTPLGGPIDDASPPAQRPRLRRHGEGQRPGAFRAALRRAGAPPACDRAVARVGARLPHRAHRVREATRHRGARDGRAPVQRRP